MAAWYWPLSLVVFGLAGYCLCMGVKASRIALIRVRKCDRAGSFLGGPMEADFYPSRTLPLACGTVISRFRLVNPSAEPQTVDDLRLVVKAGRKIVQEFSLSGLLSPSLTVQPNNSTRDPINLIGLGVEFNPKRLRHHLITWNPKLYIVVESGGRRTVHRVKTRRALTDGKERR